MAKTPELDLRKPLKNFIINGDMRIAQRQVTFTSPADGAYTLDRWRYGKTASSTHTVTQDTDVPTLAQSGYLFQNSLRMNLTAADTSIAAGDIVSIAQYIEGYNWASIAQKAFTISFWVKATLPGTYCVALRNSGRDRSYVAEYAISSANTWEYKTIIVSASPSAGTWNYSNNVGIEVNFVLAVGTTFQTTAGTWQTGNFLGTVNQVNGVNTGATDFRITGVCVNEGAEAMAFKPFGVDFESELAACQRYFEKSYPLGNFSGDTSVGGYIGITVPAGTVRHIHPYKVRKRTSATYNFWSVVLGTANNVSKDVSGNIAGSASGQGEYGGGVEFVQTAGDLRAYWHFYADAEL